MIVIISTRVDLERGYPECIRSSLHISTSTTGVPFRGALPAHDDAACSILLFRKDHDILFLLPSSFSSMRLHGFIELSCSNEQPY